MVRNPHPPGYNYRHTGTTDAWSKQKQISAKWLICLMTLVGSTTCQQNNVRIRDLQYKKNIFELILWNCSDIKFVLTVCRSVLNDCNMARISRKLIRHAYVMPKNVITNIHYRKITYGQSGLICRVQSSTQRGNIPCLMIHALPPQSIFVLVEWIYISSLSQVDSERRK